MIVFFLISASTKAWSDNILYPYPYLTNKCKVSHADHPHGVNEGCTRPKGHGHPAEGLGVNCPPLGLSGQYSSPGGKAFQSSCAVYTLYCTAELLLHCILRSSAGLVV